MMTPTPLRIGKPLFDFAQKTYVMGILNITPDSFSDGGKFLSQTDAMEQVAEMVRDGVDIVDIGGESTRPGAHSIDAADERARVLPVIREIHHRFPDLPISIDTQKKDVAEAALDAGANMVNDVSALRSDPRMACLVAEREVPIVLMHMQGTPGDMQLSPTYDDVMKEIIGFLQTQMDLAISAGAKPENIVVDPGIGFGKALEHNVEIFRRLPEMACLGRPVLLGHSRKSMIGALLGGVAPEGRLEGTLAAAVLAVLGGVHILRVHDVGAVVKTLRVADAIYGKGRVRERVEVKK